MRHIFLLMVMLFLPFSGSSQEELLSVDSWYLHYLVIDGDTIYNNITPDDLMGQPLTLVNIHRLEIFEIDTAPNYVLDIGGIPIDYVTSYSGVVDIDENTIFCEFLVLSLAGVCEGSTTTCSVQNSHFRFYVGNGDAYNVTLQYEITYNENNVKILTITLDSGDIAVYSGDALLSLADDDLTSFRLMSNLVSDFLNLETTYALPVAYRIYSISGSKVLELSASTNKTIDVSSLQKGLYFLEIISDRRKSVFEFIKD